MHILIIVLLITACIIALVLIIGIFSRKDYKIEREIIIDAPLQKVFDFVKFIKNQDHFNKWLMGDPGMEKIFKGTDGTIGFIYEWHSKKGSDGEQEIKEIIDGKNITTEIRFIGSWFNASYATITTEAVALNQTKVRWSNASKMKYPLNVMLPLIEKILGKDMAASLNYLKNILEQ